MSCELMRSAHERLAYSRCPANTNDLATLLVQNLIRPRTIKVASTFCAFHVTKNTSSPRLTSISRSRALEPGNEANTRGSWEACGVILCNMQVNTCCVYTSPCCTFLVSEVSCEVRSDYMWSVGCLLRTNPSPHGKICAYKLWTR